MSKPPDPSPKQLAKIKSIAVITSDSIAALTFELSDTTTSGSYLTTAKMFAAISVTVEMTATTGFESLASS